MANVTASKLAALSHRAMATYADATLVQALSEQCKRHGVALSLCQDTSALTESLIKGKINVLFVECDVLNGEYSNLISDLQSHRALESLFIVVYCRDEISQERARAFMGANAIMSGVFSDVASGDKRGYNPRKIHWCAGRSVQFLRACGQAHGLSPAPGLSLS